MARNRRQEEIKKLVTSEVITSQDTLISMLKSRGIFATQGTLSRDIKDLKIIKAPMPDGSYAYKLSDEITKASTAEAPNIMTELGFISLDFSGNIGVLKTLPGYAMAIASEIDKKLRDLILGTVAGDDTIFFVIRDKICSEQITKELTNFIPTSLK